MLDNSLLDGEGITLNIFKDKNEENEDEVQMTNVDN
jgi:hypothetical protein